MITAEKLALLTNFPAFMLTELVEKAGHKGAKFNTARFLGITNGGQFCYSVGDGETTSKVFVSYNSANNSVTADFTK